jgi:butyryl-CoA dehydrogenase
MTTLINPRHLAFVLWDVLEAEDLFALPAFAGHDRASAEAMLETAEQMARDVFLPSYAKLDANEPRMENGRVVLPAEIEDALTAFREAGFFAMAADTEAGGLGLPRTVANAAFLWFQAANISVANYAMLTMSAAELLHQHGTGAQKVRYMAPMIEGRFLGTMALSEPHAGSSLGDITTTARPLQDGRYALRGTKMWISGGEHDMAGNIVHLMLARIEGAPKGVRGISLFAVPRKRLDDEGRPTTWNHIALAGLNHKMGQRGTVNTVLSVGDGGDTIGELIGGPGQGLACMFTMMNEARIGVSMGAVAHASAGYRHSLAYAGDRRQGRHPDAKDPAAPQIPIIEHADVRRMLMQQKVIAEGGVVLALYLAKLADLKKGAESEAARADAGLLLDYLTPIFKAWVSDECLVANSNAMQVLGGAGYTRDHPLEQYYRDNRLNPIHEGTNGIQAIDLAGRKTVMAKGRANALLQKEIAAAVDASSGTAVEPAGKRLGELAARLAAATEALAKIDAGAGNRRQLALAPDFMEAAGAIVLLWMWVLQGNEAARRLEGPGSDRPLLEGLISTSDYAGRAMGQRADAALRRVQDGKGLATDIDPAVFE